MQRGKVDLDLIVRARLYHKFLARPDECKSIWGIYRARHEWAHVWISLDDIETLELTYRGSQLSPMTRPHTPKNAHRLRSSQVKRGPDGLRAGACSDGPHSSENLNLAAHFFRFGWSASVTWDRRGRREAPTVRRAAVSRHQRCRIESDPAVQSVTDPRRRTLTFLTSQIPSQGHIVAPAGHDWEGG